MHFRNSTRALMAMPPPEKGFVLPVVLGVGVIIILLGVMMIERSSQNRIAAIAQKANARSSAAAENGITQIQALLNRYRPLATYCSDPSLSTDCGSATSWQTVSNTALDPCSTNPNEPITRIQSYARQQWSNATSNPADGQFRLISYQYQPSTANPNIGTGTLVVQGRINPDDSIRTATAQIQVNFNITRDPGLGNPPGLWIAQNQTAQTTSSVALQTNVRDSTCLGDGASSNPVQQFQRQTQLPYAYQPTPGIALPELSPEGNMPATNQPRTYFTRSLSSIDNRATTLPRFHRQSEVEHERNRENERDEESREDTDDEPEEVPEDNSQTPSPAANKRTLTYRVKANAEGQSIRLTNPTSILKIGTGAQTVVLNLTGGMTIAGGGKILLDSGANLIIYAHGAVNLAGNGSIPAIEQEGTPSAARVQIYVYPSDSIPAPAVSLSGDAAPLYLVLVAPASVVTSSARVQGSIWAKSWQGEGSAAVVQDPLNASDLKLTWPPRISPITAWQRGDS